VSLLTVAELRDLVQTGLSDTQVQRLIDREEAEVVARYGAHYDGTAITEVCSGGTCSLFLKRKIGSVSSITEAQSLGGATTTLTSTQYAAIAGEGRIVRLSEGTRWGRSITVSYIPVDDRPLRKQVLIELVRLALEQTAMKSENVAGEYSYQAPEWEAARAAQYRRLQFEEI
jgi:hypothetical protein